MNTRRILLATVPLLVPLPLVGCATATASAPTGFGCLNAAGEYSAGPCPGTDRDRDGVPDHLDGAPTLPEDLDGDRDDDGVPDPGPVAAAANADDTITAAAADSSRPAEATSAPASAASAPTAVVRPPERRQQPTDFSDIDGDGVYDAYDLCPERPEDVDFFEDNDGCPEEDNDADGILDEDDLCPNDHGETCEGGELVEVGGRVIFEPGSATMRLEDSLPALEAILELIAGLAVDVAVEIHGHTDDLGAAADNQGLSLARATAVKRYLVGRGIAPRRLLPRGFGERVPIAPNDTAEGRAENRRVEFRLHQR